MMLQDRECTFVLMSKEPKEPEGFFYLWLVLETGAMSNSTYGDFILNQEIPSIWQVLRAGAS